MRFYLPKSEDGKLLPITCSEQEFAAHVGSGVAIYMHFVKMTGSMFFVATVTVAIIIAGYPETKKREDNVSVVRTLIAVKSTIVFMVHFAADVHCNNSNVHRW